jgi:hypothetical protein
MSGHRISDLAAGAYFTRIQLIGGGWKAVRWVKL